MTSECCFVHSTGQGAGGSGGRHLPMRWSYIDVQGLMSLDPYEPDMDSVGDFRRTRVALRAAATAAEIARQSQLSCSARSPAAFVLRSSAPCLSSFTAPSMALSVPYAQHEAIYDEENGARQLSGSGIGTAAYLSLPVVHAVSTTISAVTSGRMLTVPQVPQHSSRRHPCRGPREASPHGA